VSAPGAGAGRAGRASSDLSDPAVLRRLVRISAPPWGRLGVATALGVAAALATIGLLAGSGYLVDKAWFRPGLGAIAGLLAAVEVLAFIRGPLRYGERLEGHDAAFRALSRWRVWLYDQLEPRSPAGLRAWRSGDLLARAVEDVDVLQDLYLRGLLPVSVAVAASSVALVLVGLVLPVAALVLGVALALALVVPPLIALASSPATGREAEVRGTLAAEVVDLLQGAPDLLAFGHEDRLLARAETADAELTTLARRRALAAGASAAALVLCVGVAVVVVLVVTVQAVHAHRLDAVMLAVPPLAAIAAFESVPAVTASALRMREVAAAGRRLLALEDIAVPVVDPERPGEIPPGSPRVALADARLRYGDDLPWALDGVSLALEPGSRTAVVGASGAGKTSLVNVLLRFWPLASGTATLAGVPLESLAQDDVRRAVALVDQDARLFAGTVGENITLARPGATSAEVADAVRLAQLEPWVAGLPDGLDTAVGEGGARVSGGQRRRIALARALLAGGPVLILDEPTAGLDEPTAERLLTDVLAASGERTVLLVTHRQREAEALDQMVVLERGRVVDPEPAPPG